MNFILRYIDEIMDYFPVNKVTKKMRKDLFELSSVDYEKLTDNGIDEKEAASQVIENIAGPETLAKMIPNNHVLWYYGVLICMIGFSVYAYQFITQPDFLQIFLPARFEFPQIVERLIEFILVAFLFYPMVMLFYRYLPQKFLNRSFSKSMFFLYLGTILSSLYFSICMAYIWFTFNGFMDHELTSNFFLKFMNQFYHQVITPLPITVIYGCFTSLCFIFSGHFYHLERKPGTYDLSLIYKSNQEDLPLANIVPVVDEEVVEPQKEQKSPSYFKRLFTKKKKEKDRKKIKEPTKQELPEKLVLTPIVEEKPTPVIQEARPVKKKKRKNKYPNIKIANDLKYKVKKAKPS